MMLVLRCVPTVRQVPRLQLKLQHTCATCLMSWPSSDDQMGTVIDILFGEFRLTSKYQWCVCGRIHDASFARDRNYRARWRRRRER